MLTNFSSRILMVVVLATGCMTGDSDPVADLADTDDDDVEVLSAEALAGEMEFDAAVQELEDPCEDCEESNNAIGRTPAGNVYGHAFMRLRGDYLLLTDFEADSQRVGMNWEDTATHRHGLCSSNFGADTTGSCNKDFPEGGTIRYRIGRCNGSRTDCTKWENYVDVSGWISARNDNTEL
jgi:hypothetical protein